MKFSIEEGMMGARLLLCVSCAIALLSGCRTTSEASASKTEPPAPARPQPAAPAPAVAEQEPVAAAAAELPIDVKLRVEAATSKGRRFIESDEALRSGDRVALHVSLNEPAYVYVGHTAADGKRSVVFPQAGSQVLAAGMHRIPEAGRWFRLDRDAGQEDLFVYASRKPLTSEQASEFLKDDSAKWRRARPLAKAGPKKAQASSAKPAPAAEEPGALSPETRGLSLVAEEGSEVESDKDLTKVHFLIRHKK